MRATRPLRILYLIDELESLSSGGTERQILEMARHMSAAGLEVWFCFFRRTEWLDEEGAHAKIFRAGIDSFGSVEGLKAVLRTVRWMRRQRFDLVQTFFVEGNLLGPVLAKAAGVKVVVGSRRNANYWMSTSFKLMQSLSNKLFVDSLVANCEAVRRAVSVSERTDARKIRVIPNSIDVDGFAPDPVRRADSRRSLGFNETDVVVGMVASLRPVKGTQLFLRAAAEATKSLSTLKFVLVGDGPLRADLETEIRSNGLADRFFLAGAQHDLRPYLSAFDMAVLCSDSEGLSNSVLEYLAAGLPTVVTDVGANAELVGDAGIVVAPGDLSALVQGILSVARKPDLRNTMKEKALSRVSGFRPTTVYPMLMGYYQSLVPKA